MSLFPKGAWFNATEAAAFYGKRPVDWLKQKETKEYIDLLCQFHKVTQDHFIKTKRGKNVGGTWFHPKLGVAFARWCDVTFSVWCDDQISTILSGNHPHFDWKQIRHSASASFKVMADSLQARRTADGKQTLPHHYVNESKLINFVLTGQYLPVNRDLMTDTELTLLSKLETKNSVLIGMGLSRKTRKELLIQYFKNLSCPATTVHELPLVEVAA